MKCRHCSAKLDHVFIDLGFSPPSNAYLKEEDLMKPEIYYPLSVFVCNSCWLVQTNDIADAKDLFSAEYAYFSSVSSSWVRHAKSYANMIIDRLKLSSDSHVVEIASNDGYLLQHFLERKIPCLGIEPTESTAMAAEKLGIPVTRKFFGSELARSMAERGQSADLLIGNNVYAHVPDINDFTKGLKIALKPGGTITLEFPHLLELIRHTQFDTIYHEHFSYLSLHVVQKIFGEQDLKLIDVERLPTHGGSLRIYGAHRNDLREEGRSVKDILEEEKKEGLLKIETYTGFQVRADRIRDRFVEFLFQQKQAGKKVVGYGAAAKGNTLLNYAGIKPNLLPYICDAAPSKQGKYMPGSHIPIVAPERLKTDQPDVITILPWNIYEEVVESVEKELEGKVEFHTALSA